MEWGKKWRLKTLKTEYISASASSVAVYTGTQPTWLVRTYCVGMSSTQTRLNRHGICYKGLLVSAQNPKLHCCYLGLKKNRKRNIVTVHATKMYGGWGSKALLVLNIDNTWRRIVSSMPLSLYPRHCEDWGFQYEARLDKKKTLALPKIRPQAIGCPAPSPVTMPTELTW